MSSLYRLTGRIETGELAELYKAVRVTDGASVVVKLFHVRTSDLLYARALAETSRTLSTHPMQGILPAIDMGLARGRLAVVRDWVEGQTLGTVLLRLTQQEVSMPTELALAVWLDLLDTLDRAHQLGVVHGALTPGNILLSRKGQVAASDFGALRALHASPQLRVLAPDGRSVYRAPEVLAEGNASAASDVYSLGAIGYELLTLREAVIDHSTPGSTPLDPPSALNPQLNPAVDAAVMRALHPHPLERFQTAGRLATAVRELAGAYGSLPGREELRRFFSEALFPQQLALVVEGPVPFEDPFELSAISGTGFATHTTPELPRAWARPRGSTAVTPSGPTQAVDPRSEETQVPLEPPADSPPAPPPWPGPEEGKSLGPRARARLRASEDFQGPPPPPPPDDAPSASATPPPPPVPPEAPAPPFTRAEPEPSPLSDSTTVDGELSSAQTDPGSDDEPQHREEEPGSASLRRGAVGEGRRRRLIGIGLMALLVLGAGGLVYALLKPSAGEGPYGRESAGPPTTSDPVIVGIPGPPEVAHGLEASRGEPAADAADAGGTQPASANAPPSSPEQSEAVPAVAAEGASGAGARAALEEPAPARIHRPARRSTAAFLTLQSNIPARVFIDGERVRKRTPLTRYPVKPGKRTIVVEAIATGERSEYTLELKRGRVRKVREKFKAPPMRRQTK